MLTAILITSVLLQFSAAFLALRLIASTGRRLSWILIAAAIIGMTVRRLLGLSEVLRLQPAWGDYLFESMGLAVSAFLLIGVAGIRPLFESIRQSTARLAESENRFRTVAEFSSDWVYWLTPGADLRYMTPSCLAITGYDRQEFLADPELLERIVHPDDLGLWTDHAREEITRDSSVSIDFRIMAKDGSVHWIDHYCQTVHAQDGTFLGRRIANRLIDGRKDMENRLRMSEAMYKELVQSARSLILRVNRRGEITFVNEYALQFLGFSMEDLLGKNIMDTLAPEKGSGQQDLERMVAGFESRPEESGRFEHQSLCKDGSTVWISWSTTPIRGRNGTIEEFLSVGLDISAKKEMERLQADMAGILRHDLKSPLSGIISCSSLLQTDANLRPDQREVLKAMEEQGGRLLDMINRDQDIYKLESGMYAIRPARMDMAQTIRAVVASLSRQTDRPVSIRFLMDGRPTRTEDTFLVHGEEMLIYTMLTNLLRNAVEASRNTDHVDIALQRGDPLEVSIHNSLPVPEAIRSKFFQKFTTAGKKYGTGLGAYSARLIAEAHQGSIAMRTSEEDGTTVVVSLPCQALPAPEASLEAPLEALLEAGQGTAQDRPGMA